MFAFIDESGHTGKSIDDNNQQIFYTLGLVSKTNIDVLYNKTISSICEELKIDRLHAVSIPEHLEYIAFKTLSILKNIYPRFCLCIIEKDYLAMVKLYDTLFDNYENKGARFQSYQIRPLRFLLLYKLMCITPIETAYDFYKNCLFAETQDQANESLMNTCNILIKNLHLLSDQRAKEIINDTLNWAIDNPTRITTYNSNKQNRWRHLPNMASFLPTLDMISKVAAKWGVHVKKIIHDEQLQMRNNFIKVFGIVSNREAPDEWTLYDNGYVLLRNLKESNFEMKSSRGSVGLQIVDICLYLFTHRNVIEDDIGEKYNSFKLINYIIPRIAVYNLTKDSFIDTCRLMNEKLMSTQLDEKDIQKGQDILNGMEKRYLEKLANDK